METGSSYALKALWFSFSEKLFFYNTFISSLEYFSLYAQKFIEVSKDYRDMLFSYF